MDIPSDEDRRRVVDGEVSPDGYVYATYPSEPRDYRELSPTANNPVNLAINLETRSLGHFIVSVARGEMECFYG